MLSPLPGSMVSESDRSHPAAILGDQIDNGQAGTRASVRWAASGKLGYVDTEELSLNVRCRVMAMTKGLRKPVRVKPGAAPEMKIVHDGFGF